MKISWPYRWKFAAWITTGIRRFRIPWLFCCAGCIIWLLVDNFFADCREGVRFFFLGYPFSAALFAISLKLYMESGCRISARTGITLHLLWLAYILFLSFRIPYQYGYMLNFAAMLFAVFAGGILFPDYRKKSGKRLWYFLLRLFSGICISMLLSLLIFLMLFLLSWSMETLLGTELFFTESNIAIFSIAFVIPTMLLNQIPSLDDLPEKYGNYKMNPTVRTAFRILFLPIVLVYFLLLYVYLIIISISWVLPDNSVCIPVSVLAVAVIVLEFLFYPDSFNADHKVVDRLLKWMPLVILPLLFLMSVSIVLRMSEYGITVSRLYVLLVNLIFYAAVLLMFFNKKNWIRSLIVISALSGIISSVGPQSFTNTVLAAIKNEIVELSEKDHIRIPIQEKDYIMLCEEPQTENEARLSSCVDYLIRFYPEKEVEEVLSSDLYSEKNRVSAADTCELYEYEVDTVCSQEGYAYVKLLTLSGMGERDGEGRIAISTEGGVYGTFVLQEEEIRKKSSQDSCSSWVLENEKARLVISVSRFRLYQKNRMFYSVSGYLFYNR